MPPLCPRSFALVCAATIVTLLPALAPAQPFYAAPPPVYAAPPVWPAPPAGDDAPPPRTRAFFSLRLSIGDAVGDSNHMAQGTALLYGASVGARVFVPAFNGTRWLFGGDVGVDRSSGFGGREVTQLSVGLTPGFTWTLWGFAWTPRLVLALTEAGDKAWGMRNGIRILFGGGVVDVEFAHQFLTGNGVVGEQLSVSLGLDPGMLVHVIAGAASR